MNMRLRVEFVSDWHIGSGGFGVEGTDRGVVRDHHGFPYVPAKTLTGVLRDSMETVVVGLGGGWDSWVDVLFGSQPSLTRGSVDAAPRPAAVSIRPAFMSDSVKAALSTDEERSRLTHVKAGVAIDDKTGTARERHLNFIEVARPVELVAHVEIDVDIASRPTVVALLRAACAFTESIGGRRRKGLGRCVITLEDDGDDDAMSLENAIPEVAPKVPERRSMPHESTWADDGSKVVPLDLVLTARTPLIVDSSSLGNIVSSGDAIPGAALLPHLHRWIEAAGADARTLIGNGLASALRAVPAVDGERSLPASFALQRPKDGRAVPWRNTSKSDDAAGDVITKQVRSGWIVGSESDMRYVASIPRTAVTHNVVDDEMQKPTAESAGGLFTYVAVQAGTSFHARFMVPESLRSRVSDIARTEKSIRVGRSKKDDYGWLDIDLVPSTVYPQASDGDIVRVWATADVIPSRGTSLDDWVTDLGAAAEVDPSSLEVDQEHTRVRFSRIDSWHSGWGFPRPTLSAIAAGSCLVLRASDVQVAQRIRSLTGTSTGDRTAEGFGEIAIDHPLLARAEVTVRTDPATWGTSVFTTGDLSACEKLFVDAVKRAVARQRVRAAAVSARARRDGPTPFGPLLSAEVKSSQLSRLRSWVQHLDGPLEGSGVTQLEHDTRQWPAKAREVARDMLTKRGWIWDALSIEEAERTDGLWGEAVRSLVEVVYREATRGNS
jgi:CRISPR-associated protein Csx10